MDGLDIAAGFALVYGLAAVIIAVVALIKRRQSLSKETKVIPPLYVAWIRCDTQIPVSSWVARACGDDPDELSRVVRRAYPDKFDVLVVPTDENPN